MKTIKLLIILLALSASAMGQVVKYRAKFVCTHDVGKPDKEWGEWKAINMAVVIDAEANRITVYSQDTQTYDIIYAFNEETSADGSQTWAFQCVNEEGKQCNVRLINRRDGEEFQKQLYIDLKWFTVCYNLSDRSDNDD